jgi:hypothetical protein
MCRGVMRRISGLISLQRTVIVLNVRPHQQIYIYIYVMLDASHNYRFALLFDLAYNRGRA